MRLHLLSRPEGPNGRARDPTSLPTASMAPYGPVCVPRQTSRVAILSRTENIFSLVLREQGTRGLLWYPSFRRGAADDDSIGPLGHAQMPSASAIFPARPRRTADGHVHAVFTSARSVTPFRPENVSGVSSGRKAAQTASGSCSSGGVYSAPDLSAVPPRFSTEPPGPATGGAVPARCARCARWPAVPSRCPTRDARPRRGP